MAEEISTPTGDYDVHEWGVLAGCESDTNYFATSRPLKVYAIREPLIYIHSRDKSPFSLHVTFLSGRPTETYPTAVVTGACATWTNVHVRDIQMPISRTIPRESYVPLKDIMATLSDVDSDLLTYEGQSSRFLFYEGAIPFTNKVSVNLDLTNRTAIIRNTGALPVYDLCFVQPGQHVGGPPFAVPPLLACVKILDTNQIVETTLMPVSRDLSFERQLTDLGFTQKEAASFNTLWRRPFLQPGQLVYRLAAEQCDRLTELNFVPKPAKCVRALYVVVKVSGKPVANQLRN